MAAAQAGVNHGDEWGLSWYLVWRIYASIRVWTHSQNSLAAAEALSLKIPPMEHISNDHKDHPNQHKNSHKPCDETGIPDLSLLESKWKLIITWSECPNERKAIVEQILASEEINNSKRAGMWESQSGIWVGKLTIW